MTIRRFRAEFCPALALRSRFALVGIAFTVVLIVGCGEEPPAATVEGTLVRNGEPLGNCLVTFLPDSRREGEVRHSTGLTNEAGQFRLRFDDQREGVVVGSHRVTIQDLSVSTGVRRRDHGTADAERSADEPRPPVRRSRIPQPYASPASTPIVKQIQPGHQTIDLELE